MIESAVKNAIRDIPDFPKPGIIFKDITPVLRDPALCRRIVHTFVERMNGIPGDVIVGIESRGFLFGMMIAQELGLPFVPVRKKGKLPGEIIAETYDLEYGTSTIEIHQDSLQPGQRVWIHDDLLATGGTVCAASRLIQKLGAEVAGYSFLVGLDFLEGKELIKTYSENIITLANY